MLLPQKSHRHFFFHYKEIYPYNISIESSRKVKRAKKKFNRGIISWSNTNFSEQTSWEWYRRQQGEWLMKSGGERIKKKTLFFVFFLRNEEEDRGDQQSQVNCNFEPTFYQFEIKPLDMWIYYTWFSVCSPFLNYY